MQKAADATGRSISEIATDILSRVIKDPHTTDRKTISVVLHALQIKTLLA
jgi:hypothetical protein